MRLRYTPTALAELDDILAYIRERSPSGARRGQSRIRAVTRLLSRFPESGRRTTLAGVRRMPATPFPFLIFYQVTEDACVILGVRHSAREPDEASDGQG